MPTILLTLAWKSAQEGGDCILRFLRPTNHPHRPFGIPIRVAPPQERTCLAPLVMSTILNLFYCYLAAAATLSVLFLDRVQSKCPIMWANWFGQSNVDNWCVWISLANGFRATTFWWNFGKVVVTSGAHPGKTASAQAKSSWVKLITTAMIASKFREWNDKSKTYLLALTTSNLFCDLPLIDAYCHNKFFFKHLDNSIID